MPAHVFKPACAFLVVGKGESIKVLTDWPHPGEAQHTALETAHSVCAEIPTVEQRWHPHRDDNPRRAANEQSRRKMGGVSAPGGILGVCHGEPGTENVFEKALQERGHGSVPERKYEDPMLRPPHVVLRRYQNRWDRAFLEILLRPQQREFEFATSMRRT